MYVDLAQAGVAIPKHRSVPIRSGPGTQMLVLTGCVWVTQEGDGKDYILASGDAMAVRKTGLTLVMALEDSTVSLAVPEKSGAQPAERHYPKGETVDSLTNRAKQLRAEYIGHLAGRFRGKLRRAVSGWSEWIRHPGSI
ncbi:MAG: DUF2917 domain-containing protein [Burkholderiales bacterium]